MADLNTCLLDSNTYASLIECWNYRRCFIFSLLPSMYFFKNMNIILFIIKRYSSFFKRSSSCISQFALCEINNFGSGMKLSRSKVYLQRECSPIYGSRQASVGFIESSVVALSMYIVLKGSLLQQRTFHVQVLYRNWVYFLSLPTHTHHS